MQLPDTNKRIFCPMQHLLVINENKQKTEKRFVISNVVTIVSYLSKKSDQNEVHTIEDVLQCSMSSAYCWGGKASTKRGNLISQVHNT